MTKNCIHDQLEGALIHATNREWDSSIILALKKDGSLRFSVDFIRLDSATVSFSYQLSSAPDETWHRQSWIEDSLENLNLGY